MTIKAIIAIPVKQERIVENPKAALEKSGLEQLRNTEIVINESWPSKMLGIKYKLLSFTILIILCSGILFNNKADVMKIVNNIEIIINGTALSSRKQYLNPNYSNQ